MIKLITFITTFSMLILFSCQQVENDEVDVIMPTGFTLGHHFWYSNNTSLHFSHQPSNIRAKATRSSKEFYFEIGVENLLGKEATGKDFLSFKIAADTLKPSLIGSYTLKSIPNKRLGEAAVYYVHYTSTGVGTVFESGTNPLEGFFQIQTYDPKRKIIGGDFTLILRQVKDPYTAEDGSANDKKGDIAVNGTFVSLRVQ